MVRFRLVSSAAIIAVASSVVVVSPGVGQEGDGFTDLGASSASRQETPDLPDLLARARTHPGARDAIAELARRGAAVHVYLLGTLRNPGPGGIPRDIEQAFGDLADMSSSCRVQLTVLAAAGGIGAAPRIAADVVGRLRASTAPPSRLTDESPGRGPDPTPVPGEAGAEVLWRAIEPWLVDAPGGIAAVEELLRRRAATPFSDEAAHARLDRVDAAIRAFGSASALLDPGAWRRIAPSRAREEWAWVAVSGGPWQAPFRRDLTNALEPVAADADPAVRGLVALALRAAPLRGDPAEELLERLAADADPDVARRAQLVLAARAKRARVLARQSVRAAREQLGSSDPAEIQRGLTQVVEFGADAEELAERVFEIALQGDAENGFPVRTFALQALASIGAGSGPVLARALASADASRRELAGLALARFSRIPAGAVETAVVAAAFADPEVAVRAAAEQGMWRLEAATACPRLVRQIVSDPSFRDVGMRALERLTMRAVWRAALAEHGGVLLELLDGDEAPAAATHEMAFRLLGRLDRLPDSWPRFVSHDDERVRHAALRLLVGSNRGRPEWFDAVRAQLTDDVAAVREQAVSALASLGAEPASVAAAFAERVPHETEPGVRLAIVRATAGLGTTAGAIDGSFESWWTDGDVALRVAILVARIAVVPGTERGDAAVAGLRRRLADPGARRRAAVLLELARAGVGALPLLDEVVAALDDTDEIVRKWAVGCLRAIGAPAARALPRLEALRDRGGDRMEMRRIELAIETIRG